IGTLVALIGVCYLAEMFIANVPWGEVAVHSVLPSLPNSDALAIAVGIIGATVMPHAIYLHSGLTQGRFLTRSRSDIAKVVRLSNIEVIVALAIAGMVNLAMVIMAASAFHEGHSEVAAIETAYHTLTPLLGAAAAGIFLVSLIASGISSSVVGTMAGQVIMQGFVGFYIPIWVRRAVTMIPAFAVVAWGFDATQSLVLSQVILSIALPVPMIALVMFTRNRSIMGEFVNSRVTTVLAVTGAVLVLSLNLVLILDALGARLPFA
ncbi:MAG: Nramp family divalent metal transporter, partial [Clostridia bacterium]|nr:Nramp family divalent metal transporter [Deltaproteobacteria bacterium]